MTTNVDHQFQKAEFQTERIFATQGDYGAIQCEKGCHPKIYDAEDLFRRMDQARHDCLVPSYMVPKCPVCGGNMQCTFVVTSILRKMKIGMRQPDAITVF